MIKKIKEKSTENIKDFIDYKQVCVLTKKRSPLSIMLIESKEDPWFIFVKTYKTKTGIVTDSSMIINSDVKTWVTHLEHLGWEIKK